MARRLPELRMVPKEPPRAPWTKHGDVKREVTGARLQRRNERIKQRDNYTCQNRQCRYVGLKLQVDHMVPLSQGGTEHDDNLQTLCVACNQAKGLAESRGIKLESPSDFDPERARRARRGGAKV